MVDPITIGSLVAAALGMAAEVALKGVVKGRYHEQDSGLKQGLPTEAAPLEVSPF